MAPGWRSWHSWRSPAPAGERVKPGSALGAVAVAAPPPSRPVTYVISSLLITCSCLAGAPMLTDDDAWVTRVRTPGTCATYGICGHRTDGDPLSCPDNGARHGNGRGGACSTPARPAVQQWLRQVTLMPHNISSPLRVLPRPCPSAQRHLWPAEAGRGVPSARWRAGGRHKRGRVLHRAAAGATAVAGVQSGRGVHDCGVRLHAEW